MKIKILLISILCSLAINANAAKLYVNGTDGSNAGDCTTVTSACKTIEHAYSNASVGDEILITKGTYTLQDSQFLVAKAVAFKGGYGPTFEGLIGRSTNAEDTIIKGNGSSIRLFALNSGHEKWVTFDTLTLSAGNHSDSGTLHTFTPNVGAWLRLNNVIMHGNNVAGSSGAVEINIPGDKLEIFNSRFENNTAGQRGGAIAVTANAEVSIDGASFVGNKAPLDGAAIYANNGTITITNSTFSDNTSTNSVSHGAIVFTDSVNATLRYNTIAENQAGRSGGVAFLTTSKGTLFSNLILNNEDSGPGESNLIVNTAANFTDEGYNYIGVGGQSGLKNGSFNSADGSFHSTYFKHKDKDDEPTSKKLTQGFSEVVHPLDYYGGSSLVKTYKIKSNSVARDAIPNNSVPFYGVGTSTDNPFISLKQARASVGMDDTQYKAGNIFYFDLEGSYTEATQPEFIAGADSSVQFSAAVDAGGWVETSKNLSSYGAIDTEMRGNDNNEQWVRGEPGLCSGLIKTDGRGLPRADRVDKTKPLSLCDVGAFEFNDYYQVDCEDEDGMRSENSLTSIDNSWCVNPFDKENLTPQKLLENMGAFHWYWSLVLLALFGVRRKFK